MNIIPNIMHACLRNKNRYYAIFPSSSFFVIELLLETKGVKKVERDAYCAWGQENINFGPDNCIVIGPRSTPDEY